MKLYEELAAHVSALIEEGTLRPGERVPSVRQLVRERRVSPATAMRAYQLLEARGLIETRPRSGYYVCQRRDQQAPAPRRARSSARTTRVDVSELVFQILDAARDREVVPLGSAFPSPTLFPWPKLARYLGSAARHMDPWSTVESLPPGSAELRRQIARRYLQFGTNVSADEIIITCGALEALNLSLQVLTSSGRRGRCRSASLLRLSAGDRSAWAQGSRDSHRPARGRGSCRAVGSARQAEHPRLLAHDDLPESARRDDAGREEARARAPARTPRRAADRRRRVCRAVFRR